MTRNAGRRASCAAAASRNHSAGHRCEDTRTVRPTFEGVDTSVVILASTPGADPLAKDPFGRFGGRRRLRGRALCLWRRSQRAVARSLSRFLRFSRVHRCGFDLKAHYFGCLHKTTDRLSRLLNVLSLETKADLSHELVHAHHHRVSPIETPSPQLVGRVSPSASFLSAPLSSPCSQGRPLLRRARRV